MSVPVVVLDPSLRDPHAELWFVEPPGFVPLPLDALLPEPGSMAADSLRTAAVPFLNAAPDEEARRQFITVFAAGQQLLAALRDAGTVHCSLGVHRDDIGELGPECGAANVLVSVFTVSWRDVAVAPRGVTAARAVTGGGGHSGVEFAELPCGPATFSETTVAPTPGSGLPQRPLLQVHAHLPHPDCRRLAVLSLTTTAPVRRQEYRALLRLIAESVGFEDPRQEGEERREGSGRRDVCPVTSPWVGTPP
ncbi:hypothetical protein ACFYOV_13680 [Streptomyces sp. NPDC005931]|uniref:hypothetical protein n=1 Tax=Streptomyces sp. NPDC005931 TaxID=3364737 RepID=UPI0036CC9F9E